MFSRFIRRTEERVTCNTAESVNLEFLRRIEVSIDFYGHHPELIEERLRELDEEWDIERVLELNASLVAMGGLTLGLFWRKWNLLPMFVAGFLALHAVQGWCPPLPILRRLGVRTTREINLERYALKAIRGDFRAVAVTDEGELVERIHRAIGAAEPLTT